MQLDIRNTDITTSTIKDYSVAAGKIDDPGAQDETYWDNLYFNEYLGYYQTIPELKKAIDTYATWVLGQGYTADSLTKVLLDNLKGWGEDSFLSILWNLIVTKKFNGDAFAEIIRADNKTKTIINLKPLNPRKVRIVVGRKGTIKRYDYTQSDGKKQAFKPEDIFHLSNDRIADQIHGTSVIDCVKWVIETRQEVLADIRRISHRATIRVLYVDEDDITKRTHLKRDYADAIKKGEVLILPGRPKDAGFQDLTIPPIQVMLEFTQYLENFFYQAVGVPKAISGGVQDNTEASAKVGMVVFDPIYIREITDLTADIWSQLGLRVEFTGQKSMMDNIQSDEVKNTGQTNFQPNDVQAGVGQ